MKNKITSFKNESEILPDKGHPNLMSRGSDFGLKTQFSFKSEMRELNLSMGKLNVETNLEMSCYLKEKCNVLEKENILLKNEIAMKMSKLHLIYFIPKYLHLNMFFVCVKIPLVLFYYFYSNLNR